MNADYTRIFIGHNRLLLFLAKFHIHEGNICYIKSGQLLIRNHHALVNRSAGKGISARFY